MTKTKELLGQLTQAVQQRFTEAKSLLSFDEYLDALQQDAALHCRNSSQYIHDAISHFGTRKLKTPTGSQTRYRLFDAAPDRETWVAGQEQAQNALYRMLENFRHEGRTTRMLLFHGPNGSGKSSLVGAVIEALEHYSQQPEGALYRFNWVFPSGKIRRSGIGFSSQGGGEQPSLDSYAHLDGEQIDARLTSPLKDHPLLLLPSTERQALLQQLYDSEKLPRSFKLSQYLLEGQLSHRNQTIFNALMAHHNGNFAELLRYVQIERYYISRRYRQSVSTIEAQMHVDASMRQIKGDHSLAALPKYLANLSLFEPSGSLIDANRGVLEYSDLLKRPPEAFKYLLGTCENGRVNIEPLIVFLDLLLLGTANDLNLDRFKQTPEFMSFKSRLALIRVPYLLRVTEEQQIYDHLLEENSFSKPVAPHLTKVAALWAVLTRLKHVDIEKLPEDIAELFASFTPLEKAQLYDKGTIPYRFNVDQAKKLRQHLSDIYELSQQEPHYEGRLGASPRELRVMLLNAAQNEDYPSVSPLALLEEFEKFVQERSVYEFLNIEPKEGYYDAKGFIEEVRQAYISWLDTEFLDATGIVQPDEYSKLLTRYIQHIKADLQKETVLNTVTGNYEKPDESLMSSVEEVLLSDNETSTQFRQNTIGKIAAFSLENPQQELDIPRLFAREIQRLEQDFFSKQRKPLERLAKHCLMCLLEEEKQLDDQDRQAALDTLNNLRERYHYPEDSLRGPIALLLRERYSSHPPTLEKKSSSETEPKPKTESETKDGTTP